VKRTIHYQLWCVSRTLQNYYQMAVKRATGEVRQQALAKLNALNSER
jgi:hypothetical protein